MKLEDIRNMTEEERRQAMLNSLSETVRNQARQLALTKAIANAESSVTPEEFDEAFSREYTKFSEKFVGKKGVELAFIGLAEVVANGGDLSDILGD